MINDFSHCTVRDRIHFTFCFALLAFLSYLTFCVLYCIALHCIALHCIALYCIDSTFVVAIVCLHAGFACATPTPCTAMKLGKEIERVRIG